MDTFSPEKRSWIMAQVRSAGNKSTEQALIALLKEHGIIGWRRSYPLFGRPDFAFPKQKVAVFVDGCFWHGHPKKCRVPASNREYWLAKINRNIARDKLVTRTLRNKGWKVVRIWEDALSERATIVKIRKALA